MRVNANLFPVSVKWKVRGEKTREEKLFIDFL